MSQTTIATLQSLASAANEVIQNWEMGDLAGAITNLTSALEAADNHLDSLDGLSWNFQPYDTAMAAALAGAEACGVRQAGLSIILDTLQTCEVVAEVTDVILQRFRERLHIRVKRRDSDERWGWASERLTDPARALGLPPIPNVTIMAVPKALLNSLGINASQD